MRIVENTPLKLLDYYTEEDKDIFPGRSNEISELVGLIDETFADFEGDAANVIVLSGESGTGKTSLVRAGLIPKMEAMNTVYFRVGSESPSSLVERLEKMEFPGSKPSSDGLTGTIGENFVKVLSRKARQASESGNKFVLILDQFEDWLARRSDGVDIFPGECIRSVHGTPGALLIFVLRSDWLPEYMEWLKALSILIKSDRFYYLRKFNVKNAAEAIQSIFFAAKGSINGMKSSYSETAGDIAEILSTLDERNEIYPPYIQIVCSNLLPTIDKWDVEKDQEAKGEILQDILSNFFDREIFMSLSQESKKLARELLDYLVGREGLRRKLKFDELERAIRIESDVLDELLNTLIDKRIIRRLDDGRYELIHDFLSAHFFEMFTHEKRRALRLKDMFRSAMQDWVDEKIPMDNNRVILFLSLKENLDLSGEEEKFLTESMLRNGPFNLFGTFDMKDYIYQFLENEENERYQRENAIYLLKNILDDDDIDKIKKIFLKNDDFYFSAHQVLQLQAPKFIYQHLKENVAKLKTVKEGSEAENIMRNLTSSVSLELDDELNADLVDVLFEAESPNIVYTVADVLLREERTSNIEAIINYLIQPEEHISTVTQNLLTWISSPLNDDRVDPREIKGIKELIAKYENSNDETIAIEILSWKLKTRPFSLEELDKILEKTVSWSIKRTIFSEIGSWISKEEKAPLEFLLKKVRENEYEPNLTEHLLFLITEAIAEKRVPDVEVEEIIEFLFKMAKETSNSRIKVRIFNDLIKFGIKNERTRSYLLKLDLEKTTDIDLAHLLFDVYSRKGDLTHLKKMEKLTQEKRWELTAIELISYFYEFGKRYPQEVSKILRESLDAEMNSYRKNPILGVLVRLEDEKGLDSFLNHFKLFQGGYTSKKKIDLLFLQTLNELVCQLSYQFDKLNEAFQERIALGVKDFIEKSPNKSIPSRILLDYIGIEKWYDRNWLFTLHQGADSLLIRAGALICLSRKDTKTSEKDYYYYLNLYHESPFFMMRACSLFALGNLELENDSLHKERMKFLASVMTDKGECWNRRYDALDSYLTAMKEVDKEGLEMLKPSLPTPMVNQIKKFYDLEENGEEYYQVVRTYPTYLFD